MDVEKFVTKLIKCFKIWMFDLEFFTPVVASWHFLGLGRIYSTVNLRFP